MQNLEKSINETKIIDHGPIVVLTTQSDKNAKIFVWIVWLIMVLIAFVCLVQYSRNIPITEDWLLVPPLTGNEPHITNWLWAQNNEHRIPFPRLLLLVLLKAAHGDFRVGMLFNLIILSMLAVAMMQAARSLRGRTSVADAFFPLILLHLGNWENLFWSWQLTQVVPTILTCALLLIFVERRPLATQSTAIMAGTFLMLLPLCGANGLLFVPLLACWLLYCGVLHWRTSKAQDGQRWIGGVLIGSAVVTVVLTGLYFVGYERPAWTPPNPGLGATLKTTLQFLALGFGPVARTWFPLAIIAAIGVLLPSLGIALLGVFRHQGMERQRALGVLVFFGSVMVFALAMGWGRAGVIVIYGSWPIRYVLLAVPAFCTAFFIWELYGPPRLRTAVQGGLLVAMCLVLPANTVHGFWWNDWYQKGTDALEHDLLTGTPLSLLAEHHRKFLFHSMESSELARLMWMLHEAGSEPFTQMQKEFISHEKE